MSRGSETPGAKNQTANVGFYTVCYAGVNALRGYRKKAAVQGVPSDLAVGDSDSCVRVWTKRNGHLP